MTRFRGVAAQSYGIYTFGFEVFGYFLRCLALVDENEDPFNVAVFSFQVSGVGETVFGGCFTDGPDGVGAGEGFVAAIGFFVNVYNTELDAAGNGVEVWGYETSDVREASAEVVVETTGDGGRAQD